MTPQEHLNDLTAQIAHLAQQYLSCTDDVAKSEIMSLKRKLMSRKGELTLRYIKTLGRSSGRIPRCALNNCKRQRGYKYSYL